MRPFRTLATLATLAPAVAIATIALALAAGAASANGGGHGTSRSGVLEAEGHGIAAAAGKLKIHLCAEEGILLAKGEVAIDEGSYSDEIGWLGLHVYFDFAGCADITGGASFFSGFSGAGGGGRAAALVVGTGLTLRAEGTGIAYLQGEGTWADGNGETGDWSEDGDVLKIGGKKEQGCESEQSSGYHGDQNCETPEPEPTSEPTAEPEPEPTEGA